MAETIVGELCKHEHEHEHTGGSVRYKNSSVCVECKKNNAMKYYENNMDSIKVVRGKYYDENRDEIKAADRKRHVLNKERDNEYQREYRNTHVSELKKYRDDNADRRNAITAKWQSENVEHREAYRKEYDASEHGRTINHVKRNRRRGLLHDAGEHTTTELKERLSLFHEECAYCGSGWEHVDHIVPLYLGGDNTMTNLVPACMKCNASKGYNMLEDWYPKQPFYDRSRHDFVNEHTGADCEQSQMNLGDFV